MSGALPATIDPVLLAEKGTRIAGRLQIRGMARLRASLLDDSGEAQIDILFSRAEGSGSRRMHGRIFVPAVSTTCQRCLEPMQIELIAEPDAVVLREGELKGALAPEVDVLTVGQAPLVLSELIEDELLLVLPMVPMHPLDQCPAKQYVSEKGESEQVGNAKVKQTLADLIRAKRDPSSRS